MQRDAVSTSFNTLISTAAIAVRPTYRMAYKTYNTSHSDVCHRDMPGRVYNFQGRASFIDIIYWDREMG